VFVLYAIRLSEMQNLNNLSILTQVKIDIYVVYNISITYFGGWEMAWETWWDLKS